uniref:Conserved secreted protein n=1 Tax=Heterorhabditis bacteriophora TaxID=37862 RepID=A0A1I7XD75_HETBA
MKQSRTHKAFISPSTAYKTQKTAHVSDEAETVMRALTTTLLIVPALAQINLGTFSFHPRGGNGWDMGMSQGANIFGFGGDRGLHIGGSDGGVGIQTNGGALVGGERIGVDSGIGVHRSGLDIGSQLQFGNNPQPFHPAGQLGSFFDNMRNFFYNFIPFSIAQPVSISEQATPDITTISANSLPSPSEHPDVDIELPHQISRSYRMGTEGRFDQGEFIYKSELRPWEFMIKEPNDGESTIDKRGPLESIPVKTLIKTDDYSTDPDLKDLFTRSTERPRQLPGLVEFN